MRRFAKGDGNTGAFIEVVNGDYNHFNDNGGPQKSVNFLVAHDGFNLADLVSYPAKNNGQPAPFGPSDGGNDDNMSWDSGGDQALRRQRLRNFWAILMLSRGVPMVVAGDEMGRTQNGNNNPWAIDTIAMRNNYAMLATNDPQGVPVEADVEASYHDNLGAFDAPSGSVNPLFRFARSLMRLRREHPALHQAAWGDERVGGDDVSYLFRTPTGEVSPQEGDRALRHDQHGRRRRRLRGAGRRGRGPVAARRRHSRLGRARVQLLARGDRAGARRRGRRRPLVRRRRPRRQGLSRLEREPG